MQFCDFELEERPPPAAASDNSETALQCVSTTKDILPPEQHQVSYQLVLYPELQSRPWIQLLGEVLVDMNVFLSGNERCMSDSDYPWNSFRPTMKVEEFKDGSMQSFHENVVKGRLAFQDIITLLMQQPLSSARIVGEKLTKYQQKIVQVQDLRKILLQHYSEEDLKIIFAEIQEASIQKAMGILSDMESKQSQHQQNNQSLHSKNQNSKIFYLYIINAVNESSLLPTPVIVGQNSSLVELMGGGQAAYKHQMIRKGYLNFDSYYSHLQMLLLELGIHKECWLQARTLEGLSVPIHITISHALLHKLQLAPIDASFNSTLTIYNIEVPQYILNGIQAHREKHKFEGFQDDLSYMLHCQIFLQKHYHKLYDLSSDRRCTYKTTTTTKELKSLSVDQNSSGKSV